MVVLVLLVEGVVAALHSPTPGTAVTGPVHRIGREIDRERFKTHTVQRHKNTDTQTYTVVIT